MIAFDELERLIKNVVSRHSSGGNGEMSGGAGEMSGGAGEIRYKRPLGLSVVRLIFEPRISRIQIRNFTF